ncbi:MAG: cyclase family protein [Firmicutes bacterium]|nr:cyclase family protein [Bacillota bacterium]
MKNDWIDLSVLIDENTLVYPGDPPFTRKAYFTHELDSFSLQGFETGMHIGTHLDSPYHFLDKGISVDEIKLDKLIGKANKISVQVKNSTILTKDIEEAYLLIPSKQTKLLIDTAHSAKMNTMSYFDECPLFEKDFIDFLNTYQIELIGLDLPTIQYSKNNPLQAHLDLLSKEIVIVENLIHLPLLEQNVYFVSLPLKLKGFDGSMVRAIAKNINTNV